MAYLVLVRHGLSEYNKQGLWTGWQDPDLTLEGVVQAKQAGEELKDIHFDIAYTSALKRAKQTLDEILKVISQQDLEVIESEKLNERDYGDFTLKNKWQVKEQIGPDEFLKLRRSWDYPVPNGESLKQVSERIWPYFNQEILPELKDGKNVIIASSGNAFRALIKPLENLSEEAVADLEFGIGEAYVYKIDNEGKIVSKQIRNQNTDLGKI